jgi:hypothetical protein
VNEKVEAEEEEKNAVKSISIIRKLHSLVFCNFISASTIFSMMMMMMPLLLQLSLLNSLTAIAAYITF